MINKTVVIFDVFKTLIDIQTDEENTTAYDFLSTWLAYMGIGITADDFHESFRQNNKLEYADNPNKHPDIDVGDVFKRLYTEIEIPASIDINHLIRETALIFRILTTKSLTIYPETHTVLQELYQHPELRLCIASNTQRLFTIHELRKFDLEKYFEFIIFSSDVKACKPNPKLFLAALEGMKVKPSGAIYIGDNLFDDVGGAQKVGLRTIWIDRRSQYKFPDDFEKPIPDEQILGEDFEKLPDKVYELIKS